MHETPGSPLSLPYESVPWFSAPDCVQTRPSPHVGVMKLRWMAIPQSGPTWVSAQSLPLLKLVATKAAMVRAVDLDALRDRAGKLGGPHLSAFGHVFCLFERYHRRHGQEKLVKQVLLQVVDEGEVVVVVVDVHCH